MFALLSKRTTSDYRAPIELDGHISYGQSWRSNTFDNFGSFGFNPAGPIAFLVSSIGAFLGPGPMPGSAGIALTGLPIGTTHYQASDYFQLGRCAILAQQLLRVRDGVTALSPILEFCTAYPGSTWHSGGGGGLAPGSSFVGSVSGLTLTVTSLASGNISGGQMIVGAGVNAQTRVYANLTLARAEVDAANLLLDNDDLDIQQLIPGGVGTYSTSISFTSLSAQFTATSPAASFTALANNGVLTVTAIASGSLAINQVLTSGGAPAGTIIQQQLDGTPGGLGTYVLGLPQTVASESMLGNGVSWTNMVAILNSVKTGAGVFPTKTFTDLLISSVGYTQGGSADNTNAGKVADLTDMMVQFDALSLNPTPLKLYVGLPASISTATTASDTNQGSYTFCRLHAPGMGGTYSGRVYATGPSYPYPFNGGDNIHTNDYGSSRWGEVEAYVRRCVQDKSIQWTPLWRP